MYICTCHASRFCIFFSKFKNLIALYLPFSSPFSSYVDLSVPFRFLLDFLSTSSLSIHFRVYRITEFDLLVPIFSEQDSIQNLGIWCLVQCSSRLHELRNPPAETPPSFRPLPVYCLPLLVLCIFVDSRLIWISSNICRFSKLRD